MRALIAAAAGAGLFAVAPARAVQLRAGDLLVTDALNARVLVVDPATGNVTPFSPRATSGPNLLFAPAGLAIDPDGAIFVADSFADRIIRIDPVTGEQSVVHDYGVQFGDFGPSDVGTAPQGIDVEDTVTGLDRRDLFVASADGLYRVSRSSDATFTAPLSSAADVQLGTDVAVQEDDLSGDLYSLWVVANGVLVRWYFENGATQPLTESNARNVKGVEYALRTPLFTRNICFSFDSLNGLFVYDGPFGGTRLEGGGYASCLGRPLAVASPTLVYGTYGDDRIIRLIPTIHGYDTAIVATLPEGDVPPVAADLAVSPVTFPAPEPASPAASGVALLGLGALARRRRAGFVCIARRGAPRSAARIATALGIALAAIHAGADGIAPARPNALLVVDDVNSRVLRVPLAGGEVTVFSPPEGVQTNLLTSPRGIGTGPDGTIVVANFFEDTVVEIDPATGAQFPVAGLLSGEPKIGLRPRDVAVNPRAPAPGFLPTLGVASQGELHQVVRNALDTTGSMLAPYPSPFDPYVAESVVPLLPGNDDPLDYVVATTSIPALLWYDGAGDTFTPIWAPAELESIGGLAAPTSGSYPLVASFLVAACPSFSNGIRFFTQLAATGSLVYPASCPGPIAYDGADNVLYFVAQDLVPPQVIQLTGFGVFPVASIAGTLPSGTSASDMALARVPEPDSAALGASMLVALTCVASARRPRVRCAR